MSSKINSKDIIIKQKEKVSSLDWSDFLQSEFDKPAFDSFISKLITNMEKGIKFQPPMKDWFSDFFNVSFADLKVVLVSKDGYSLNNNFAVPEELNKQGVMFFPLERTVSSDGKSHLDSWRLFNTYFIDYLAAHKETIVCVFIGFEASQFADLLEKDTHYKIFLPELTHSIYGENFFYNMFAKNINALLEKHDLDAVNW
jgi:uracil DNA glycosylase